ncbi:MAG: VWA domain-containing protein [Acidobacteriaceae bacterium]
MSGRYKQADRRIAAVVWLALGLGIAAHAQAGGASAPVVPSNANTAAAPGAAKPSQSGSPSGGQAQYTLQARVPLTILDVVVTDAKGKFVRGLTQADFTVLEDKQEVKPSSFEEHRTDDARPVAPMRAAQALPPNTYTNDTPTPAKAGPLNVLLFDAMDIQVAEQQVVRKRMLDFVDKLPAGTEVAVFSLYARLTIDQGFTADRELLKEAIYGKKHLPIVSSAEDPWQDPINQDPGLDIQQPYQIVDREGEMASLRAQFSLSALGQIARYLSGMPGRKNLIWFTGSFPLEFPPFPDDVAFPPHPGEMIRAQSYNFEADMKLATDLLARAHVSVYPVDGRGLEVLPTPRGFEGRNRNFVNINEHQTMDEIADETGGKAFYNNNGFAELAEQAVESGSNYYTLAYTPTNQKLDTRFRTITVKVDRPGLHLVYRPGYYAVNPGLSLSGFKIPRPTALQAAMLHGAPDMKEILFKVKVVRAPGTEDKLPDDNQRDSSEMKPPYRRYAVYYTTEIGNIAFTQSADGNYNADFEFEVFVYNAAGDKMLNSTNREVRPVISASTYESMRKDGALASQEIDIPAKGDYFLRIAVHDRTSGHVGTIEIPVSSIH